MRTFKPRSLFKYGCFALFALASVKSWASLEHHFDKTLRGPSVSELNERALLFKNDGALYLSLFSLEQAAENGNLPATVQERWGELALILGRFDPVVAYVKGGRDVVSFPASLRAAYAVAMQRRGDWKESLRAFGSVAFLRGIDNVAARFVAAMAAASTYEVARDIVAVRAALAMAISSNGGPDSGADAGWAHLQLARLNYDSGRYSDVMDSLSAIRKNSSAWFPAVNLAAWAAYRGGDLNAALGQTLTLQSPFFRQKFQPETYLATLAILFDLCQFESVKRLRSQFDKDYLGMMTALSSFERYSGTGFRAVRHLLNYSRGSQVSPYGQISQDRWVRLMEGLASDPNFYSVDRQLVQLAKDTRQARKWARELDSKFGRTPKNRDLRAQVKKWNEGLATTRRELLRTGSLIVGRRIQDMKRELIWATQSLPVVDVEVNTRIRDRLVRAREPRRIEIEFDKEIARGFEFWPFEAEYWADELGAFAVVTSDACAEGEKQ